jgi:hypothetical protein
MTLRKTTLNLLTVGFIEAMVMPELVELQVCQTLWIYAQIIFPAGFAGQRNKDAMMARWS